MSLFFALVLFVMAPIIYLVIALSLNMEPIADSQANLIMYILLIIAIVYPFILPVLERSQIKAYHRNRRSGSDLAAQNNIFMNTKNHSSASALAMTFNIIKFSLVESSFIFGLVIYFISGDMNKMLYFYPIGYIWTIIIFPTKGRFQAFIDKVERYGQTNPVG